MIESLENIIGNLNNWLYSYILIAMLITLGIYYTCKTNFVQFRLFGHMFSLLTEKARVIDGKKGISAFNAFCISAASRIGTGNIAGVAIAISLGGPGAVFWMWIIALVGAGSSFIESTLGQIYKVKDGSTFRGGPAYYIEQGLGNKKLGIVFSILTAVTFGFAFNTVQANTISSSFEHSFGIRPFITGIILLIITAYIIFGGVKRIADVTSTIVPIMGTLYVGLALFIMIKNITLVPGMFKLIFQHAFGFKQFAGGTLAAVITQGVRRGLFSNEAGMGSVPNAAATADSSHPAKQGLIQSLGVFTDTLLVCSSTAFMILISGVLDTTTGLEGVQITQAAVSSQVGNWGSNFISICVFLFAYSSIIGNYYYGETNIQFLNLDKKVLTGYRILALIMVMAGSVASFGLVWDTADVFMGAMAVINLIVITKLAPIAIGALKDYDRQLSKGEDPIFLAKSVPGISEVDWWQTEEQVEPNK